LQIREENILKQDITALAIWTSQPDWAGGLAEWISHRQSGITRLVKCGARVICHAPIQEDISSRRGVFHCSNAIDGHTCLGNQATPGFKLKMQ
jgi:hypothetical protein